LKSLARLLLLKSNSIGDIQVLRTPWHQKSVGTNMLMVPPSGWYHKDFGTNKKLVLSMKWY